MLPTSPDYIGQQCRIPLIYFICTTNMSKHCKNKQYLTFTTECIDGLFHKIREWWIKCGAIKITGKLLYFSR